MSKHNYSKYSNKNNEPVVDTEVTETEAVIENTAPEIKVAEEIVTTPVKETKPVIGTVANCTRLNVRAKNDSAAEVVCVLDAGSKVTIDKKQSTNEWFKVTTNAGVEGYCMRKFVEASL